MLRIAMTTVCLLLVLGVDVSVPPMGVVVAQAQANDCHWGRRTGRGLFDGRAEVSIPDVAPSCPKNYAIRALRCEGSFCSYVTPQCCRYAQNDPFARTEPFKDGLISDGSKNVSWGFGGFLVGVQCHGNYCDKIGTMYVYSKTLKNIGQCRSQAPFSEEGSGTSSCRANEYVTRLMCTGRYCDNIQTTCCVYRYTPPKMDPRPVPPTLKPPPLQ
jgi:hypothetical protein